MAASSQSRGSIDSPVLFLTPDGPDYLSDSLFHGLRLILGRRVIDYPRNEMMYRDYPADFAARPHGRGFTLYRRLDPIALDRATIVERLREGAFKLVVFGSIRRQWGLWLQLRLHLPLDGFTQVAFVDGEDDSDIYPYVLDTYSRPKWRWALPRVHGRYPYFKRELVMPSVRGPQTAVRSRGLLWSGRPTIRPIAFSIPEETIVSSVPPKTQDFPRHIVDPEVAVHVSDTTTEHAFTSESDYYRDLRASRFGITTKRSGWDCLRHYELAASGMMICFRDLHLKPRSCAPHGLNERNAVSYCSYADLARRLETLTPSEEMERVERALTWARENTTRVRAQEFLDAVGFADA